MTGRRFRLHLRLMKRSGDGRVALLPSHCMKTSQRRTTACMCRSHRRRPIRSRIIRKSAKQRYVEHKKNFSTFCSSLFMLCRCSLAPSLTTRICPAAVSHCCHGTPIKLRVCTQLQLRRQVLMTMSRGRVLQPMQLLSY